MFSKLLGVLFITAYLTSAAVAAYSPYPVDAIAASQNITVMDSASTNVTGANGQVIWSGTPTAGSTATFNVPSWSTAQVNIRGTWTGTLVVEVSTNSGDDWISHSIHQIATPLFVSSFTSNASGSLNMAGKLVRVRATAAMTGTAVISVNESPNVSSIYVASPVKLVDGSSSTSTTTMTIKPASTAAVASDTAIVVSVSPNNTPVLPSGAATSSNQSTEISDLASIVTNTTGAATSANQTTGNSSLSTIATNSANIGSASTITEDFSAVVASGISSPVLTLLQTGSGMTVSQSSGNLVIASGTTANSETIIRSNSGFTGSLIIKEDSILSQRIANNNFYVEMVDYPAGTTAASYTINSATSVTVTFTTNPFTSANVGQFMYLGGITGAAGIPMRAAIASVSGSTVTYTVAGWPASGTGTLLVFGWNYYHLLYTGTTATNANVGTQRDGWQNADVVATINTTASPGHLATMQSEDNTFAAWDQLVASGTTSAPTIRSQLYQNIPPYSTSLYLQVHALNGTTAPASTTTWTIASVQVDQITSNPVTIGNIKQQSLQGQLPVFVANTANVSVTNTPNVSVSSDSLAINTSTNDFASGAKTSTFTLAVTPAVASGQSYSFQLNVTAVSGTTPTMDCQILESYDGGITYPKVIYQFERVTGVLATPIVTPMLRVSGKTFEYNCIIAGTTPSFTMALWRVGSIVAAPIRYNLYDRAMVPTTTSSSGTTWFTEGCTSGQIFYYQSAVTTSPVLAFQTSPDQLVWSSTTYTTTPTSTSGLYLLPIPVMNAKYSRIFTTTGGTGVTYGYTNLTCSGT